MRTRISYRLAAISLAVAIPLLVILIGSFIDRYQARVRLVEQERIGYARLSALAFGSLVEDAQRSMRLIAESAELTRSPSAAYERLGRVAAQYPASYVLFADTDGKVVATSRARLVEKNFGASQAFISAMETGNGIEPTSLDDSGRPGLHVAARVNDDDGRPIGVMLMRIDIQRLHNEFPLEIPRGGISIIDSAGQVVFQNESATYALEMQDWGERYPFVRAALKGEVAPTRDFAFPTGEQRIGAFVPVELSGWAAGSSVDADVPFGSFWRSVAFVLPLAFGVALLGLVISAAISLRIRRALVELAEQARVIGEGDFGQPISVDRTDEIGDVASALEQARRGLQRYSEVNKQLFAQQQRVSELNAAMTEVATVLHSTLEFRDVLNRVLERAALALGCDAAGVNLREDGMWVRAAIYGIPQEYLGERLGDDENTVAAEVFRTGEPVVITNAASDPRIRPWFVERYGLAASMALPLVARDRVFGVVFFNYNDGPHDFDAAELGFATRLSTSLSLAYENARLYANEHAVAEKLQGALLSLPESIDGIEYSVLYESASETARVGGDFYDLFRINGHTIGITIGDISGHGIDAAVLTSLAKTAIRVKSNDGAVSPADSLQTANQVLYGGSGPESFATVLFGVLDVESGALVYAGGGHPAGAILGKKGARRLPSASPVVGAFPDVEYADANDELAVGETLFLYTDGLIEPRRGGEHFGEERLFSLLAETRSGESLEDIVTRVFDAALAWSGGHLEDDVAILALRRTAD